MDITPEEIKNKSDIYLDFDGLEIYVLILTHYDEIICREVPYRGYYLYIVSGEERIQIINKDSYEWIFKYIYECGDRETARFYAVKFLLEYNEVFHSRADLEKNNAIGSIDMIEDYFVENADRFSDITTAIANLSLFFSENFIENFESEIDQVKMYNMLKMHSFIKRHVLNNSVELAPAQIFPTELKNSKGDDDKFVFEI